MDPINPELNGGQRRASAISSVLSRRVSAGRNRLRHAADAYARLAFFTRLAHFMIFVGPTGNMRITRGDMQ